MDTLAKQDMTQGAKKRGTRDGGWLTQRRYTMSVKGGRGFTTFVFITWTPAGKVLSKKGRKKTQIDTRSAPDTGRHKECKLKCSNFRLNHLPICQSSINKLPKGSPTEQ